MSCNTWVHSCPLAGAAPHGAMQISVAVKTPFHKEATPCGSGNKTNGARQPAKPHEPKPPCPGTVRRSSAAGAGKCPHAPDWLTPAKRSSLILGPSVPSPSSGYVSRCSPLGLRCGFLHFTSREFDSIALAPNSTQPSARSLHFRHRTARPKPAGPVRWLVAAARRRQSPFDPIHDLPASPTRSQPPRPTSRRAGTSPRLATETLASSLASAAPWTCAGLGKSVAPLCSVLVHSIGLDLVAPATMLVPARLGLRAESDLCPEPRTQHDVANSAAPATHWQRRRSLDGSTR